MEEAGRFTKISNKQVSKICGACLALVPHHAKATHHLVTNYVGFILKSPNLSPHIKGLGNLVIVNIIFSLLSLSHSLPWHCAKFDTLGPLLTT